MSKQTHGEKALETLRLMETEGADWFHPAIKWVEEKRLVWGTKTCPDCGGEGRAYYGAADAAKPFDVDAPAFEWQHDVVGTWTSDNQSFSVKDCYHVNNWKAYFRARDAQTLGLVVQTCRLCRNSKRRGRVGAIVEQIMMVGYILWPIGVRFAARFGNGGESRCQCQLCGKGINKSGRVPLAHAKGLGMFVGQDCARKFTGWAKVVKPGKGENKKGLESILAENYEVPQ